MKTFIPNIDDGGDSDDSGDEIPPGGVFHVNGLHQDISDIDDELDNANNGSEVDYNSDEDRDAEQGNGSSDDGEDNMGYEDSDSSLSDEESEVEATLHEIFEVEPNMESTRDIPPAIEADSGISDICFHPQLEIIAAATLDGEVILYRYSQTSTEEQTRFSHHRKSCRAICFTDDGNSMFTISKDKSLALVDTQNSAVKILIEDAHEAPIYSFCPIDEYLCATGDDDGVVKIWDFRRKTAVYDFKTGEQTVTCIITDEKKKTLCTTVNDGSIAGFNIRGKKLIAQSEMYDSEFTSAGLIRNDSKLVVGSGEGSFLIFNWGEFGRHVDRFAGHPDEIHCVAPITDRLVLTGCEDGIIRATHFYPHRYVGVVGQHRGSSVDNLSLSCDTKLLASCGMDETIRFWNIEYLFDVEVNGRKKGNKKVDIEKNLPSSRRRNHAEFFSDFPSLVESDDENGPVAGPSHTTD